MSKSLKIFCYSIILFSFLNGLSKSENKIQISETFKEEATIEEITIRYLNPSSDVYMGPEGYFYLKTDFYDNISEIFNSSDIEENTIFNTTLRYYSYYSTIYYNVSCNLWILTDKRIIIFCKVEEPLVFRSGSVSLTPYSLIYKSYNINIAQPTSSNNFYLQLRNPYIPFLYSNEQIINIEEGKKEYELKFKFKEYNNEFLFLNFNQTYKNLENCNKRQNNIVCLIEKGEIEEILQYNNQKYGLSFYHDTFGLDNFDLIENISLSFNTVPHKQNIYIGITKLLSKYISRNNYAAFETNVTSILNVISGKFYLNNGYNNLVCYLKKSIIDPLLLLCKSDYYYSSSYYYLNINEEIELNNSNIKYNFLIQPVTINDYFYVYDSGNEGIFVHPKVLDFSKYDKITIYYLMNSYSVNPKIKLNPDSSALEFINGNYEHYKSYRVERKHFENKKSGYYYSYYYIINYDYNSIFYELPPIQVVIPNDYKIFLNILKQGNPNTIQIGENGMFILITNYNDNEYNILDKFGIEQISFITLIEDDNGKDYQISCRFWKPNIGNIRLICTLQSKLINFRYFYFGEIQIYYNKYTIDIYSNDYLEFQQLENDIPLLYSEPQNINIIEQKNSYNIKFNIGSYNNELLIMNGSCYNSLLLDNCQSSDSILNCQITKEKLEEILTISGEQFNISAINDKKGIFELKNILPITVKYENIIKQDIYVKFEETTPIQGDNPLVLKTNINNIQNIHSNMFSFFEIAVSCFFKKTKINPLFFFCMSHRDSMYDNYTLNHEVILSNIHYKYNFRIQPFSIKSAIYIPEKKEDFVYLIIPEELIFKSQNSMSINFIINEPSRISQIYLISENSYLYNGLSCNNLINMKRCDISISNFLTQNYKEVDYYSISYYSYYSYIQKIDYMVAPIKVTLPTKIIDINIFDSYTKLICKNGDFFLISSYDDTSANIFDASNIEEKTLFQTILIPSNYFNQINITCHLWKPKNNKIVIICQINDNLDILNEVTTYAYFNETIFDYNGYKVVIYSNNRFYFKITGNYCPFLYADNITINLRETDESYDLQFKIKTYNNEPLLLSTDDIHYISLENCTRDWNNLFCKIEQSKIIEQYNNQAFKLYYISQIYGFQEFGLTPEVYITSSLTRKETINVQILRLLQNSIGYNNYIAYSTNTSNISNIVTGYFLLQTNKPI